METQDIKMEFVYMDSYNCLLEGARKTLEMLDAEQIEEAAFHLENSIKLAQHILKNKLDLSFFKF